MRPPTNPSSSGSGGLAERMNGSSAPAKKKSSGCRLWLRFDRFGRSEISECDKSAIIKRASIPSRDLRILGPLLSGSSNILAREKALVVNMEFIKAIITTEEVLLLDPLGQEVITFVDQLRQQFPFKGTFRIEESSQAKVPSNKMFSTGGERLSGNEAVDSEQSELPFEFQVLEIALEVVCAYLDSRVTDLEKDAYPLLDDLAKNVSRKKLENVRSLKSGVTRLFARVLKVRDEIEHLLDDDQDMANFYQSRRLIQNQQLEALIAAGDSSCIVAASPKLVRLNSTNHATASFGTNMYSDEDDVEDLEMLLEAYFVVLDGIRNRIISVREYINDTEDYVNIQLDNQRNQLIQLHVTLGIVMTAISINTLLAGAFAMNIPSPIYEINHIFTAFVGGTSIVSIIIFLIFLFYARRKKLLGS